VQIRASSARGEGPRARTALISGLETLAFSGVWPALVAMVLLLAGARAMQQSATPAMWVLAFGGTLFVYDVDRLRDVERDRATAPRRTAFVVRHRRALILAVALAGTAAVSAAWTLGPGVCGLCAGVLALGLLHRRIKHVPIFKGLYVTSAWLAVVVGVPAVAGGRTAHGVAWTTAVIGVSVLANVVASSLRDTEAGPARSPRAALAISRLLPALGMALALLGPVSQRSLVWIPAVLGLALVGGPRGERYGHIVVDGALLVGGLAALIG